MNPSHPIRIVTGASLLVDAYQPFVGTSPARPGVEVPCEGVTEVGAKFDAAIKLRVSADLVRVWPALPGRGVA